jgi:flagellar motor switch protein FliG
MSQLSPSLRKAAVLIASLDERAAEALLQQMSSDDAAKVRSAIVELDAVSASERDRVLAEFLQAKQAPPAASSDHGVDLQLDPDVEAAAATIAPSPPVDRYEPIEDHSSSFDFLADVETSAIVAVLSRELPQTVAVVVAHLPAERAAALLQQLSPALATEALERIAWLDQLSPEVQADLARELRRLLAPHIRRSNVSTSRLPHLNAVLGAMDFRQRQRLVLQLGERNRPLMEQLGLFSEDSAPAGGHQVTNMRYRIDSQPEPAVARRVSTNRANDEQSWLTFDDLLQLDDRALRAVFAATEAELALIALTGAEPRLVARILKKLPTQDAAMLRRRLEHPGPLRLRDIEQARSAVAAVASRLAHEGTIELPAAIRFATAV